MRQSPTRRRNAPFPPRSDFTSPTKGLTHIWEKASSMRARSKAGTRRRSLSAGLAITKLQVMPPFVKRSKFALGESAPAFVYGSQFVGFGRFVDMMQQPLGRKVLDDIGHFAKAGDGFLKQLCHVSSISYHSEG